MQDKRNIRLGETLIARNSVTKKDIELVLAIQKKQGGRIGEILIGEGLITAYELAKGFAENQGKPFIDLRKHGIDESLLDENECENYLKYSAIPWKDDGGKILIATTEIHAELIEWAGKQFSHFDFVITSPFDVRWAVQENLDIYLDLDARDQLWNQQREHSAKRIFLSDTGRYWFIFLLIVAMPVFLIGEHMFYLMVGLQGFYLLTLLSKILFVSVGVCRAADKKSHSIALEDRHLPVYTILIPMFEEKAKTIEQMIHSIRMLNYPKSRLDVKLIIEEGDENTLAMVKSLQCESYFHIVDVPYSYPQTKPKACNYALKFAQGDFVCIFDAEDRPDPMQLKKVLEVFWRSPNEVACVQARLNYYNRNENMLTKLFAIEYASWFMFMIPALEKMRVPIPLGGTSNHFKTAILRKMMAWDPYNVTEDADLGIRLAQHGYCTAIVNSLTLEEAPITLKAWIKQRSRWIKGYMQTYFVHMRRPIQLYKKIKMRGFIGFLFFVGAPSVVFLTMPFSCAYWLYSLAVDQNFPDWYVVLSIGNLTAALLLHIVIALIVLFKNGWRQMGLTVVVFPFYWLLHMLASFRAVKELVLRPHYWDKTEHGVSDFEEKAVLK